MFIFFKKTMYLRPSSFSQSWSRLIGVGVLSAASLSVQAAIGVPSAIALLPASGQLTVEVAGLKNLEGQVCLSLFDSSAGFPDDDAAVVAEQCVNAATGTAVTDAGAAAPEATEDMPGVEMSDAEISDTDMPDADMPLSVTFEGLGAGTYAVSILHDENSDGEINQGAFGIPTEGFGFSRNPEIKTGAPEFYETAVFVFGETTALVNMVYF